MGRPPGTTNVTNDEVKLIRSLFRQGVKITEIVEATERSESVGLPRKDAVTEIVKLLTK